MITAPHVPENGRLMVAVSGTGWRLAPALVRLVAETDRLFPHRSIASDGSIGDRSHAARASDHNPSGGWVDAVDLTDDDAHGCDVGLLVHHLVASKDKRISYLIHRGTIWRGYSKPGLPAFTPQRYTGPNAHKLHAHVSVKDEERFSTRPWWPQVTPQPPRPPVVSGDCMHRICTFVGDPSASGDQPDVAAIYRCFGGLAETSKKFIPVMCWHLSSTAEVSAWKARGLVQETTRRSSAEARGVFGTKFYDGPFRNVS